MTVKDSPNRAWRAIRGLAIGVITLVLGGVLIAVLIWLLWGSTRAIDAHDGVACGQLYRNARTAADTARVDAQWPTPPSRPRPDAHSLRCGALRAAGRVPG